MKKELSKKWKEIIRVMSVLGYKDEDLLLVDNRDIISTLIDEIGKYHRRMEIEKEWKKY